MPWETEQSRLILTSSTTWGDARDRAIRRAVRSGELTRLRRGVAVPTPPPLSTVDRTLRPDEARRRYLDRIGAVAATRRGAVIFGLVAAIAIHDLPHLGPWPSSVDIVEPVDTRRRSKNGVVVHRASIADEDVTEVHGLLVTSPARTIADLARAGISRECVVALDYTLSSRAPQGLRLVKEELIERVVRQGGWGRRRAVELIEFGDGRSGSPGETGSRLIFAEGGFESPELQHHYPRHGRRGYDSDFWWKRSLRGRPLAGEFDGAGKYLRKEYLRNKTPGEAVVAEKRREDYMRRCDGSDFMRWGFPEVMRPPLLRALAIQHGVPRIRRN